MSYQTSIYEEILTTAAKYANTDERRPVWMHSAGDIFRVPTKTEELALEYDVKMLKSLIAWAKFGQDEKRSEDQIMDILVTVVRDSVAKSIKDHEELFVSMIIDSLRSGDDFAT